MEKEQSETNRKMMEMEFAERSVRAQISAHCNSIGNITRLFGASRGGLDDAQHRRTRSASPTSCKWGHKINQNILKNILLSRK